MTRMIFITVFILEISCSQYLPPHCIRSKIRVHIYFSFYVHSFMISNFCHPSCSLAKSIFFKGVMLSKIWESCNRMVRRVFPCLSRKPRDQSGHRIADRMYFLLFFYFFVFDDYSLLPNDTFLFWVHEGILRTSEDPSKIVTVVKGTDDPESVRTVATCKNPHSNSFWAI